VRGCAGLCGYAFSGKAGPGAQGGLVKLEDIEVQKSPSG